VRPTDNGAKRKAVRPEGVGLPFVELLASSGAGASDDRIEILLPNAIAVRVPLRFDRDALRDLLTMLRAR
jgi:hypothetical protein